MNNEPVAYGKYIENAKMWLVVELDADMPEGYIPLYTHPVINPYQSITNTKIEPTVVSYTHPVKELTDEEIIQINKDEGTCWDVPDRFAIQIARAILRKAQKNEQ